MATSNNLAARTKRRRRIRKKVFGASERPRLCIKRSTKNIYAQVINDLDGKTLAFVHSYKEKNKNVNVEGCKELGKELAKKCLEQKIDKIVFDKSGYTYHGKIKAFADGAREGGLSF